MSDDVEAAEKPKMGRPSSYSPRIAFEIIQRISLGETLIQICRDEHIPSRRTVHRWLRARSNFRHKVTQAREECAQSWADESIEIADDGSNDWMDRETNSGRIQRVIDHEHVQRSKLRIETRRHLMSCMAPRIFGNRLDVKHGGEVAHVLDFGSILPETLQASAEVQGPDNALPEPTHRTGGVTPPLSEGESERETSAQEADESDDGAAWPSLLPTEHELAEPAKPESAPSDDTEAEGRADG